MAQTSPSTPNSSAPEQPQMSLLDHLKELRVRLARAMVGVLVGLVVGFFLVYGPVQLVDIIITAFAPLNPEYAPVQAVGTAETFTSFLTVALAVGIVLAMPLIVYQLIAFIMPGLRPREKRLVLLTIPVIMLFFVGGLAFGWFVTVPAAMQFLIGFSDSALIQIQPTLADFLHMVTLLLLINGIVFEMPIIIYTLAFLGVTTARQLARYRRYAIVAVVIVAAIITPTGDPINLLLLAVPMYFLFELGVLLAYFVPHR